MPLKHETHFDINEEYRQREKERVVAEWRRREAEEREEARFERLGQALRPNPNPNPRK